jgi:glycosyltransferase involved in cell wall biosynthesis
MTPLRNDARFYDAYYFQHGCGQPYRRSPEWLQFFAKIAEKIISEIGPRTVLDAGCAMGFLVEALRDRGVEAYGLDLSAYAIAQARADVRPFLQVGSVTQPLSQKYDLIVCIEVLEHMPAPDAEAAIANFCQAADDVLFSSSSNDFREPTHFNVQPPEHWAERFAAHGFVRDVDFDASFITPWTVRFRRATGPWHRVVRDYERRFSFLSHENHDLREAVIDMRAQLAGGQTAPGPIPTARLGAGGGAPPNPTGPVLVISHDVVGTTMAGPGIRYYHLARVLAQEFPVTLAVPRGSTLDSSPDFSLLKYDGGQTPALEAAVSGARAVVVAGVAVAGIPALRRAGVPLAVDGHNPFQAETFYLNEGEASDQTSTATAAYLQGDFFFCASERQRDWWLGLLEANGRINIDNYREDPTLRRLIDLVPYGLPSNPPQHMHPVVKGVVSGIGPTDKVLLWGGGLWPWMDPLTAIRAVGLLWQQRQDVRLLFPGTRHPNPDMARLPDLTNAARELARELGLFQRAVFFGDWVPYAEWPNYLLESDVALTLHPRDTLEARLAYRTRVLDYLWASLPIVAARGDVMAELIADHDLGAVVEPADPSAVAGAIQRLLEAAPDEAANRFEAARQALKWETAARPLIEFCRHPRLAPDKVARGARLGNAYYTERVAQLEARLQWYDGHRMLKLARRLDPLVGRVPWLRRWVRP